MKLKPTQAELERLVAVGGTAAIRLNMHAQELQRLARRLEDELRRVDHKALDALQIDIFEIAKMTPGSHSYWSSYPRLHLHPPSRDAKPRGNE